MLALGQAGGGTGSGHGLVNDLGMTQSGNLGLSGDNRVTDGAVLALGQAGGGTGGCHGGIYDFGMDSTFVGADPNAIGIGIGIGFGLLVAAVSVLQHGGENGNFIIASTLDQLIGHCLITNLSHGHTGFGAVDIGTALGDVDIALGRIHGTVDENGGIHHIGIGTGIGTAGNISQRLELAVDTAGTEGVVAPLISIVNIHAVALSQRAACTCLHHHLSAGQHSNVLLDIDVAAAVHLDGNVAVDGQLVVLGVDVGGTHVHGNSGHSQSTIGLYDQAVGAAIVGLGNGAGGQIEHTAAGTDKGHGRSKVRAGHIDGGIAVLGGTVLQSQRHLDILHVVLGQREHTVVHIGTLRAAAEVHELEHLVHGSTVLGGNGTGTGDETVGIQGTTVIHGDGAVALHLDKTDGAGGRTAVGGAALSRILLGRQADRTVDGQVGTVGQGQGTVSGGLHPLRVLVVDHLSGIQIVCGIEGDEQGDTGRNGVVPGGQGGVVHQHHVLGAARGGGRGGLVQVVKQIAAAHGVVIDLAQAQQAGAHRLLRSSAHHEMGSGVGTHEDRLDAHVAGRHQSVAGGGGQDLAVSGIDPAQEAAAVDGSSGQGGTVGTGNALYAAVGNSLTGYGDAAVIAVIIKGHIRGSRRNLQREVAQGQGGGDVGQTAVGGQHQSNGTAGLHHSTEAAAGLALPIDSKAVGIGSRIVKGQHCCGVAGVGNGDIVGLLAEQAALGSDGHGGTGHRAAAGTVGHGNRAVQNAVGSEEGNAHIVDKSRITQSHKGGVSVQEQGGLLLGQAEGGEHILLHDVDVKLDIDGIVLGHGSLCLLLGGLGAASIALQNGIQFLLRSGNGGLVDLNAAHSQQFLHGRFLIGAGCKGGHRHHGHGHDQSQCAGQPAFHVACNHFIFLLY